MRVSMLLAMLKSVQFEHGDIEVKINSSRSGREDALVKSVGVVGRDGDSPFAAEYALILDWPLSPQSRVFDSVHPHKIK